jgi:hypothetical protein
VSSRSGVALVAVLLILVAGVILVYSLRSQVPRAAVSPAATASPTASASTRPEQTKPPGVDTTQPQLPLPTSIRWAVDKGSPDDPQHRSLFELFFDGNASGFRVVDAGGSMVLRFPIAGSGVFGPETCMARARKPQEIATWIAVDQATLDLFVQRYGSYRVIADGIPAGQVTLPLTDSGCRMSS